MLFWKFFGNFLNDFKYLNKFDMYREETFSSLFEGTQETSGSGGEFFLGKNFPKYIYLKKIIFKKLYLQM